MVFKTMIVYFRPVVPIMMGLCMGITLSLICAPFLDEGCEVQTYHKQVLKNGASRKTNSLNDNKVNFDYGMGEDYEPKLKFKERAVRDMPKTRKKLLRPRYASTELGIGEKLFVGVVTTDKSIFSLGVAMNLTASHHVSKMVFFMGSKGPNLPTGMSIVIFNGEAPELHAYHMMKYVSEHYLKVYDWYMFVPDSTYIRADKIIETLSMTSSTQDAYVGVPVFNENSQNVYCDFSAGILMSQSVLERVVSDLQWCSENLNSLEELPQQNLAQCVMHATSQSCTQKMTGFTLEHFPTKGIHLHNDSALQPYVGDLQRSVTISHIKDHLTMYRVHRYYCEMELHQTEQEIVLMKNNIERLAPLAPGGRDSVQWPMGADPSSKPKSRFDVIRWDYFSQTHIFFHDDFTNMQKLKGVDKKDIDEVIGAAVTKLNEKYQNRYTLKRLSNGYRRFDPVRGMEYILDLVLDEHGKVNEVDKRVHLMRPLSLLEIIPMPYVTENTRINLILPVTLSNRDGVVSFLDSFAHTCLDSGDNTHLFVVFIYDPMDRHGNKGDIFQVLKSMITFYENKYMNGAHIAWTMIQSSNPTQFAIMDAVAKKFPPESLFLLCTVGMDLSSEFLNRVRMNTISKWQVFFPIGFWQYKPNLVYDKIPYPTNIDINKKVGHFDHNSYDHASFYNYDYVTARREMISKKGVASQMDLFDMFLKYHSLHVFRAIEPALKHRYRQVFCSPQLNEDNYQKCLESRGFGLASRSQLAMLIFEHQRNLDEGQMNVIHQQNDQNVIQMKPNML